MTTPIVSGRLISTNANIEVFFKENAKNIEAFNKKVSSIVDEVLNKTEKETPKKAIWEDVMKLSEKEVESFFSFREENINTLRPLIMANATSIFHKKYNEKV